MNKKATRGQVSDVLASKSYPDPLPGFEHQKRRGRGKAPSETDAGEALHLQLNAWSLLHTHTANEHVDGRIHRSAARQGMRSGWPDFSIYHTDGSVLHIELKREKWATWSVSMNQLECIQDIRECGHMAEICWGSAHAIALVDAWRRMR